MPPQRCFDDYSPGVTAASKRVLLEVMTALRAYREALVLVGGWVPYFLLEQHRHLAVQDDLVARKTKGCAAAFRHKMTFDLSGTLPEGGEITVPIQMANLVGCLAMKGIVLGERFREKDAYDVYAVMANYQKGPPDVAEIVRPHLSDPLVKEAVARIYTAFATREANGPAWVATFLRPTSQAEKDRLITDAFMTVHGFDSR